MRMGQRQEQRAELWALLGMLYRRNVEPTEVLLTLIAWVWALGLLAFPDLFGLSRSYAAMSNIMDERGWSVVFAVVGVLPAVALARHSYTLRLVSLLAHVAIWLFVAVMFFLATPASLGWGIYSLFALSAIWVATRIAGEFRDEIRAELAATGERVWNRRR